MGRSLQYSARHSRKVLYPSASRPQNKRDSRTLQQIHTSPNTKTSPMTPPLSKSETNLRFESGGVMGEVLGE